MRRADLAPPLRAPARRRRRPHRRRPAPPRGGVPLRPDLWSRDYNIQSEYIDRSTFIHEFAHGLGLPRRLRPRHQQLHRPLVGHERHRRPRSAEPHRLEPPPARLAPPRHHPPPAFGGARLQSIYLRTLDDPTDPAAHARDLQAAGVWRAALVALPPKTRHLTLTPLPPATAKRALYSGQGNDLDRRVTLTLDLRTTPAPLRLAFDAWWNIEAGWDFAYLETSLDGRTWTRRRPLDPAHMPAAHGHDGLAPSPASPDSAATATATARTRATPLRPPPEARPRRRPHHRRRRPCRDPTWTRVTFALDDLAGHRAHVRLRSVTDMAAVQPGILIDDLEVTAASEAILREDFRRRAAPRHPPRRLPPEPRPPHTCSSPTTTSSNTATPTPPATAPTAPSETAKPSASTAPPTAPCAPSAPAPAPASSPGTSTAHGPGAKTTPPTSAPAAAYLLALDAWPEEIPLPGLEGWLQGKPGEGTTHYDITPRPPSHPRRRLERHPLLRPRPRLAPLKPSPATPPPPASPASPSTAARSSTATNASPTTSPAPTANATPPPASSSTTRSATAKSPTASATAPSATSTATTPLRARSLPGWHRTLPRPRRPARQDRQRAAPRRLDRTATPPPRDGRTPTSPSAASPCHRKASASTSPPEARRPEGGAGQGLLHLGPLMMLHAP
ncbi:MAG: immune inhibitor A [Myxococcales bacterium]|nr:immune inhibitor A [Myxococcales bacterium]